MELTSYVTGFVDGQGTFSVSFNRRNKLKTNIEVRPSFSISQNKRSLRVLKDIREYFGVGAIRFSKSDNCYKYEVRSLRGLTSKVIPHFRKYPLKTQKQADFEKFSIICRMISAKHHLNADRLIQIINLAYEMNESGKRRYSKEKLLKLITR